MNMTLRTPPIHARAPRPALLAAAFLLALVAAGCFEYEEELTIRKDRSGVARIRCRWTGDYKPLMDAIPSQVSTSEIQRLNAEAPAGVKYESAGITKVNGEKWIFINLSFKDVNKLREVVPTYGGYLTRDMSVPLFDDLKVLDQRDGTFRYERNALDSNKSGAEHKYPEEKKGPEVTAGPGDQKAPQPKPPEPSPEEKRQQGAFSAVLDFLRKMFKDDKLTLRYTVNFPDAVVESADATDHQGKRARWNFTFDDRKTRAARASRMTALYGRKPATSPAPPTSTPAPEGTGQKPREVRAP